MSGLRVDIIFKNKKIIRLFNYFSNSKFRSESTIIPQTGCFHLCCSYLAIKNLEDFKEITPVNESYFFIKEERGLSYWISLSNFNSGSLLSLQISPNPIKNLDTLLISMLGNPDGELCLSNLVWNLNYGYLEFSKSSSNIFSYHLPKKRKDFPIELYNYQRFPSLDSINTIFNSSNILTLRNSYYDKKIFGLNRLAIFGDPDSIFSYYQSKAIKANDMSIFSRGIDSLLNLLEKNEGISEGEITLYFQDRNFIGINFAVLVNGSLIYQQFKNIFQKLLIKLNFNIKNKKIDSFMQRINTRFDDYLTYDYRFIENFFIFLWKPINDKHMNESYSLNIFIGKNSCYNYSPYVDLVFKQ